MNKTLDKLQNILDSRINNKCYEEVSKLTGTEHDYQNVHIIFGNICGVAILQDIDGYFDAITQSTVTNPGHYYMVFLVEDDGRWYIQEHTHYTDLAWATDYAEVLNKVLDYRIKIFNKA